MKYFVNYNLNYLIAKIEKMIFTFRPIKLVKIANAQSKVCEPQLSLLLVFLYVERRSILKIENYHFWETAIKVREQYICTYCK